MLNLGIPMRKPRVAILGVWLESNRQAPVATFDDFSSYYHLEGAAILDATRAANPRIMGEAAAFVKTIRAGLEDAENLDAVYIANHGAMLATNDEDPDGSIIALVRELVGPAV